MKRYIGYIETINLNNNTCKIRIPSLDGFDSKFYTSSGLHNMQITRTSTANLRNADIPFTLQGLRIGDIVYVLDSERVNENLAILGFFGGTY